jgi:uncharacterized protein (DUF1697 family)
VAAPGPTRFVVLLRGVNVGKGKRVPMAEFKALLEALGYAEVKTLLNSGNAVFTARDRSGMDHAAAIAAEVERTFGVSTPAIVKSAAEMAAIIHGTPIPPPEGQHSRFLVAFGPGTAALEALRPLLPLARPPERMAVTQAAAYLYCAAGILESEVGAALLGKAGRGVTTRNWATVLKIGALMGVPPVQ